MAVRAFPSIMLVLLVLGLVVVAGLLLVGFARHRERRGAGGGAGMLVVLVVLGGLGFLVFASFVTIRQSSRVEQATLVRQQDARAGALHEPQRAQAVRSEDGHDTLPSPSTEMATQGEVHPWSAPPTDAAPEVQTPRPPRTSGVVQVSPEEIARLREAVGAPDGLSEWRKADALETVGLPPEKPWLSDAAGSSHWVATIRGLRISGRRPGPKGAIVAYSGLEPSPEDAVRAARDAALGQIGALAIFEAHGKGLPDSTSEGVLLEALGACEAGVLRHLDTMTQETALQELRGKTGNSYHRAALLVRADASSLEPLVEELRERATAAIDSRSLRRQELILAVASALGLAFVIFLLYSFLNAGTKGHFAWPLRFVSLAALILLYLGLMYYQGWFH